MKKVLVLLVAVMALGATSCGLKEIKGHVNTDSTSVDSNIGPVDSVVIDSIASAFEVDSTK